MKSVQSFDFKNMAQVKNVFASRFPMDRAYKTTLMSDIIVPFFIQETYPGDVFEIKPKIVLKALAPLDLPAMDNLHLDVMFFADANRNLWEHWPEFMGDKDPSDSTEYTIPLVTCPAGTGFGSGSIMDYLGLPTKVDGLEVSALPFRMYSRIYNYWFRDENLTDSVVSDTDNGPDTYSDYSSPRIASKRRDYFTSCLPTPQKGDDVYLPLGESAPVIGDGNTMTMTDGSTVAGMYTATGGSIHTADDVDGTPVGTGMLGGGPLSTNYSIGLVTDPLKSGVIADLSAAVGPLVNELRYCVAVQEMRERDMRYGSRLTEMTYAHFGVRVPDYRIMQPEYIGGGHQLFSPRQILQTSQSDTTDQGTRAGFIDADMDCYAKYAAVEHGFIMGVMVIRADLSYQQGIQRFWSRQTREEFYFPVMANLGEMAVLNKEIYAQGTSDDDEVFGYQDAWADLKYGHSMVTGMLRANHTSTLENWTFSEEFGSLPTLSTSWMNSSAYDEVNRILTVNNVDQFVVDMYIQVSADRPLPVWSNPQIGSRF